MLLLGNRDSGQSGCQHLLASKQGRTHLEPCYALMFWCFVCSLIDGQPVGGPCSKIDKLKAALQIHLPPSPDSSDADDELMSKLLTCIQDAWGMDIGMQKRSASNQDMLRTVMQDKSITDSSTFSAVPRHEDDPFGGEVVGGLDGDYAYGSHSFQTS